MSEGFFSRWSRRKQEAGQEQDAPAAVPLADPPVRQPAAQSALNTPPETEPEAPLPTLQDAQALTPESDFQPFMQNGVGAEVRNAAMKKLFADPHFNVMDGLDIYIDDYSQPDPMPAGMLRQMASAQFLDLVPPEDANQAPQDLTTQPGPELVAQSPSTSAPAEPRRHDDPDLQLQPDPAPAKPCAEPDAC